MSKTKTVDAEMQAFQDELLQAVRDMKADRAARTTKVALTPAAEARARVGVSQARFAELLGVSVRTLQNWEQGRTAPSGAARTLLQVVQAAPQVLRSL